MATGDAVGTTLEFRTRGTFKPITDMVGGGPFGLKPGEWTDDTSMALCLATSLLEKHDFDPRDQMIKYCWWRDQGYLSSTGRCFDIGGTVGNALYRYEETGDPFAGSTHPRSAGNGCIMRLAPIPMFYHPDHDQVLFYAMESARTTHGAQECLDACLLLGDILFKALSGESKEELLFTSESQDIKSEAIEAIAAGSYREKQEDDIVGSAYVVKSLEAALWCFLTTNTFEQAILKAANLGDDADTTAAVCGQVAGAYYGEGGIPSHWLEKLVMKDDIRALATRLHST